MALLEQFELQCGACQLMPSVGISTLTGLSDGSGILSGSPAGYRLRELLRTATKHSLSSFAGLDL